MNDTLFTIPETKSPRLCWMEQHGFRVVQCNPTEWGETFAALIGEKVIAYGMNADDALVNAAVKLQLRLWNEQ